MLILYRIGFVARSTNTQSRRDTNVNFIYKYSRVNVYFISYPETLFY